MLTGASFIFTNIGSLSIPSIVGYSETKSKQPERVLFAPRLINLPLRDASTKVTGMAAGRAHLLILTTEGLFTLGNNAYGQCGRPIVINESYEKNTTIHHIPDIKGSKIVAVTAGQDHRYLRYSNPF